MGDKVKFSTGTVVDANGYLHQVGEIINATAAELNIAADNSSNYKVIAKATTSVTLTAADSGKTILFPDMDAACTFDLPAEADGLRFKFVYVGGAEDAHGIIIDSESATNFFIGGVNHLDADGETQLAVFSNGSAHYNLTCTTVTAGTEIELLCTGVTWYISGQVCGATAPTFA